MKPRPTVQPTINKLLLLGYHVLCEQSHCSVIYFMVSAFLFTYTHMIWAKMMVLEPGEKNQRQTFFPHLNPKSIQYLNNFGI